MINLKIKRCYDQPSSADGFRVLIDRVWPRGISKENARIDLWLKDIAPSTELRKWFSHDAGKWDKFKQKYFKELDRKGDLVAFIIQKMAKINVTLLYGAKDERHNNALALKEYIETRKTAKS